MEYVRPSNTRSPASGTAERARDGRAETETLVGLLVLLLCVGGALWGAGHDADLAVSAELTRARDLSALALAEGARALALHGGLPPAEALRSRLHAGDGPGERRSFRGDAVVPPLDLEAARSGQSGEACVFDAQGTLLGSTRHAAQLRALGRVDARGRIVLREPRMARGLPTGPLLAPVRAALAGASGVMLSGYRDQRGEEAVGAYVFLAPLEVGVLQQVDRWEAYRSTWLCQLALVLAGLASAAAWLARGERASHALGAADSPADTYGQYTLGRKLGEGGMGVVYEASHRLLRRPTALKLLRVVERDSALRREALARFEREVQLTSQLTHPNTVVIYDYGQTDDGTFYYAMEYVEGVDLERWVRLDGPLPAARIIHLALQICGSLAEAHQKGLIHRDIKPANILVCERGGIPDFIKVLDFGLVKHVNGPPVSNENLLVGTPLYMAPELLRSPGAASPRSDVYSLGAVLHWLATAMTVADATFMSAGPRPARHSDAGRISDPYAGVPIDLERVIMRCLDSDPYERPSSVEELAAELSACRDAGRWTTADARAYWAARGPQLQVLLTRPAPSGARTVHAS